MKKLILMALLICPGLLSSQAQDKKILPAEVQIRIATQAAPAESRAGAKVYGYDAAGKFIVLREGTNGYICLGPQFNSAMYTAFCYPESLEPFMARGRALSAANKDEDKDKIREEEFKAGKLSIPQTPTTMYSYYGSANQLNPATGEMADAKRRYVIYMPYAKAADLGLSNQPNSLGSPWLMGEGTYKAHIMISPPADQKR